MDKEAKYILNKYCCNKNIPNNKCYDKEKLKQYQKDRIFKLKDTIKEQKIALLKYLESLFNLKHLQVDYYLINPIEITDELWVLCY